MLLNSIVEWHGTRQCLQSLKDAFHCRPFQFPTSIPSLVSFSLMASYSLYHLSQPPIAWLSTITIMRFKVFSGTDYCRLTLHFSDRAIGRTMWTMTWLHGHLNFNSFKIRFHCDNADPTTWRPGVRLNWSNSPGYILSEKFSHSSHCFCPFIVYFSLHKFVFCFHHLLMEVYNKYIWRIS